MECKCGNPAKVDSDCWYCYHKKNGTLDYYFRQFGENGCVDEVCSKDNPVIEE